MKTHPAQITEISNKVRVTYHRLPEPKYSAHHSRRHGTISKLEFLKRMKDYKASEVIAEVEITEWENIEKIPNVIKLHDIFIWNPSNYLQYVIELKLNQSCLIEETGQGKVKIVEFK